MFKPLVRGAMLLLACGVVGQAAAQPAPPPNDPPPPPTLTKDQCFNGGWKTLVVFGKQGVFKNQGDCVSFVATGGKNQPALLPPTPPPPPSTPPLTFLGK